MINGAPSTAPATASPTRTAAAANPPSPSHAIPGTSVQAPAPAPAPEDAAAAVVPSSPPRPPSPPAVHDDAVDDHDDYAMAEAAVGDDSIDDDGINTTFKYHKVIQTDALAANMAVIEQENEDLRAALRAAYLEIERQRAVIDELRAHNELEDELAIAKETINISEAARLQVVQENRDLQHQVDTLHESHDALAAENTHLRGQLISAGITPTDMDDDDDATTGPLAEAQYLLNVFTKLTKLHVSITDHGAVRCAQHLDDDGGVVVFELTPFTNSHQVDRRQTLTNNRRETLARAAQNDAFQFDPISAPDWCPPFKSLTFPQDNAAELYRFLLMQINEAVAAAAGAQQ
ncbi:hypothetical protein AMAG_10397 [Allomyces macrogynus ATCC 38327]|uniref:Uncharacterized protein n=1 Tax=Allomyces macrogynus (strain ATCC 38327) TaxID=578462 RepID=A0A0L0SUF1_ALLM3|nr:hypothetical protein AMAG_10397 [Allomyces macrogynus ATCC 38327]|eukprot:KNE66147.1 hypothetical protein AMAG_10397 [Allomyces macrogynus ATCC 38327]